MRCSNGRATPLPHHSLLDSWVRLRSSFTHRQFFLNGSGSSCSRTLVSASQPLCFYISVSSGGDLPLEGLRLCFRVVAQLCVQSDPRGASSNEPITFGREPVNTALDGVMAKLHIGAMLCFAIAVAFYIASWLPAGHGFAALGVGFEVLA